MTRWLCVFFVFVAIGLQRHVISQTPHPDRSAVVAQAKVDLQAAHFDLQTTCGAFSIVELAAWRDRALGAGLLEKQIGNHCRGFAVDILAYPDGAIFDVLISAETDNSPAWQPGGFVEPTRYRPPHEPSTLPDAPPTPEPVPAVDLSRVYVMLTQLHNEQVTDTQVILERIEKLEQDAKGFVRSLSKYLPYILTALGIVSAVK